MLGVEIGGVFKAYPFKELTENDQDSFVDTVNEVELNIHWNESARTAHITDVDGKDVASTIGFWFAWYAFHPETLVYAAN